ncbi:unnamed protein product [Durusdinium trenchii]|uniref:Uncharacterized protein n=1 Tax=Durusdinium trenchii TaxID=1381693 RepID=A0ABP0S267_9DINO
MLDGCTPCIHILLQAVDEVPFPYACTKTRHWHTKASPTLFDNLCAMRPFLILVLVVAAWSIRNNEQVMDSDGYKDLPQKGQPCAAKPCRERGRWSSKCCAEGLVCDRETFTCKVAIGQPCRGKTFYTECAGKYTYDRDLACVKDESKNYRCCIITGNRYTQFMTKNHQKYHQTYGRGRGANCCSGNSTEVMRFDYREGTDVPTQICTGKHSGWYGRNG